MRFHFNTATMSFLTKNQFDFNKLFYEGIPFSNQERLSLFKKQDNIEKLRTELRRLKKIESPEVKAYLRTNLPRVVEWLHSSLETLELDIAFLKYQAYMSLHEKLLSEHPDANIEVTFDH